MRRTLPLHLASVFTLVTVGTLGGVAQTAAANANAGVGYVTGSVYCTDTNLPARDAQIDLDPWPAKQPGNLHSTAAFTDLTGRFRTIGLAPGQYVLSTNLGGYLEIAPSLLDDPWVKDSPKAQRDIESRFTIVTVVANQTANVALEIERGTEIRGTVMYDDGSPAINLPITFGRKPPPARGKDQPPSLFGGPIPDCCRRTDNHGRFEIPGVFPGLYQISVLVPTFSAADDTDDFARNLEQTSGALRIYADGSFEASRAHGVQVHEGDAEEDVNITIPLSALHTVQGEIVLKGLGSAPAAAAIQLLYADTRELARIAIARDGTFQLNYVPEGSYILRVAASTLPAFPTMHFCPPDCGRPDKPVFGPSIDVPLVVAGDVSDLVVTVPAAAGAP